MVEENGLEGLPRFPMFQMPYHGSSVNPAKMPDRDIKAQNRIPRCLRSLRERQI